MTFGGTLNLMFDWDEQEELDYHFWARYDYINELKAEAFDHCAEDEEWIGLGNGKVDDEEIAF